MLLEEGLMKSNRIQVINESIKEARLCGEQVTVGPQRLVFDYTRTNEVRDVFSVLVAGMLMDQTVVRGIEIHG